jgi:Lrp/AsnC family leucine-responsive transcriptional regulator
MFFTFVGKMTKIDLKDRKILYHLDLNCRQSNTQIGKKVGLKKDVVSYRIKKLQDEGVITGFWTSINTFKLGYQVFRIYINFQYTTSEKKNEIIEYFANYKNTWCVFSVKGEIDLDIIVWVKNVYEFYQFWNRTLDLYEDYFANATISVYIQAVQYEKSYLLPDEHGRTERELYKTTCDGTAVEIDDIDFRLLNELAINARTPLIELANKLGCSSQMVKYRLDNLMKKEVIKGFHIYIDSTKLGLKNFKVDIHLKEHKQAKIISDYLKDKSYLECMNMAMGWADIEPEFVVKNVDELMQVIEEINIKFPGAIRKQAFWIIEKVHKERWLPEIG